MSLFQMPFLPPEALDDEASLGAAARHAVALARGGDCRSALTLAQQARVKARHLDIDRAELQALNAAAIVHFMRRDPISAVAAALDACDLAARAGELALHAHARLTLNLSAFALDARDGALREIDACVDAGVALRDRALEARARVARGVVLGDLRRFDEAQVEFDRASGLAPHAADATSAARITSNLANLRRKRALAAFEEGLEARAMHELRLGAELATRARTLAGAERDIGVEIDAVAILGCIRALQGRGSEARALLAESARLGRRSRCPSAILWVLCELGQVALEAGDAEAARSAYAEALDIASQLRPSRKIAAACLGLAEVAARSGEADAAQHWRSRWAAENEDYHRVRLQTRLQIEAAAA